MTKIDISEDLKEILSQIKTTDEDNIVASVIEFNELTITIPKNKCLKFLTTLRDKKYLNFSQLIDITAVDFPMHDKRFTVVYHLLSMTNNIRVRVKYHLDVDDQAVSLSEIFPNANWYEREVFDMYGIIFVGHNDMRRLLTDYDFEGYPLRKDFPLSGFKEVKYDNKSEEVVYQPVSLTAEYRHFDNESPWSGMEDAVATVADKLQDNKESN